MEIGEQEINLLLSHLTVDKRALMSQPLVTVDPDATVEEAMKIMAKHGIRKLPVVRDTILYRIFTARDLAKHFHEYEDRVAREKIRGMSLFSLPF